MARYLICTWSFSTFYFHCYIANELEMRPTGKSGTTPLKSKLLEENIVCNPT